MQLIYNYTRQIIYIYNNDDNIELNVIVIFIVDNYENTYSNYAHDW